MYNNDEFDEKALNTIAAVVCFIGMLVFVYNMTKLFV